jgi:hypothetical protein
MYRTKGNVYKFFSPHLKEPNQKSCSKTYIDSLLFFDNLGCPDQRSEDTRTSTNPSGTRNTLLARVSMIGAKLCLG